MVLRTLKDVRQFKNLSILSGNVCDGIMVDGKSRGAAISSVEDWESLPPNMTIQDIEAEVGNNITYILNGQTFACHQAVKNNFYNKSKPSSSSGDKNTIKVEEQQSKFRSINE